MGDSAESAKQYAATAGAKFELGLIEDNTSFDFFKDIKFDNKVQIARDIWTKEKIDIMNTDPWISLSVENQETLNYLYNILEIKSNED